MAQNLTVAGALSLALVAGGTAAPISLAATIAYLTGEGGIPRVYAGAISNDPVSFGTISAGAKGVLVMCLTGACTVTFQTTANEPWPLSPGGYFLWCNPSTPFPTAAFITTTGAASVLFLAVG